MTMTVATTAGDDRPELVGTSEAAEIFGISAPNFSHLHRLERERGWNRLPAPLAVLRCGPIWRRGDIEQYADVYRRKHARRRRRRSGVQPHGTDHVQAQSSAATATDVQQWGPPSLAGRVELPAPCGQ